jgi:hypothetical protein
MGIENFFAKLKQFRAIATRYNRIVRNFLAAVHLSAHPSIALKPSGTALDPVLRATVDPLPRKIQPVSRSGMMKGLAFLGNGNSNGRSFPSGLVELCLIHTQTWGLG